MISEKLITLLQVFRNSDSLREWCRALGHMPDPQRCAAIRIMAEQMRAGGENADLIDAISSLANPQIFSGLAKTLRDLE